MDEIAKAVRSAGSMITLAVLGTGGFAVALAASRWAPNLGKLILCISFAAFLVALGWVVIAIYTSVSQSVSKAIAALPEDP